MEPHIFPPSHICGWIRGSSYHSSPVIAFVYFCIPIRTGLISPIHVSDQYVRRMSLGVSSWRTPETNLDAALVKVHIDAERVGAPCIQEDGFNLLTDGFWDESFTAVPGAMQSDTIVLHCHMSFRPDCGSGPAMLSRYSLMGNKRSFPSSELDHGGFLRFFAVQSAYI